ncbi:uncharacterized protein LOC124274956 isoform X1 [Haliotis rubra]|uniref:uncharacterized protein LOC124274956 isoform X1 n=1 Tax=Haliotis rubra TaxID=36100 RepID=UPI001EE5033E|nr:uncharacterized protein LOC124274956 isoform X1 [Haliotis rubra]
MEKRILQLIPACAIEGIQGGIETPVFSMIPSIADEAEETTFLFDSQQEVFFTPVTATDTEGSCGASTDKDQACVVDTMVTPAIEKRKPKGKPPVKKTSNEEDILGEIKSFKHRKKERCIFWKKFCLCSGTSGTSKDKGWIWNERNLNIKNHLEIHCLQLSNLIKGTCLLVLMKVFMCLFSYLDKTYVCKKYIFHKH